MLLLFGTAFSCLSLVNHYLFRTTTYDLGYFNNAIADYSHLRPNIYSLTNWFAGTNTLGDHFEPFLLLVAPLTWIFGEWTLLLLQIAAVLLGGLGVYRFVQTRTTQPWLPHLGMFYFFSVWGIYSALAFDYHNNVVGAMLLPWFLHHLQAGRWRRALPWFLLILSTKENMALWMAFVCIGMMPTIWKEDRRRIRQSLAFAAASAVYFIVVMKWVMPLFWEPGQTYEHLRLTHFGETPGEAMLYLLSHPWEGIVALFANHTDQQHLDGIKAEVWLMLLLSGGFLLLRRPGFIFMLIPIFLQKFLNDKDLIWGVNFHYSIEFVPVLAIGIFGWLVRWQKVGIRWRTWAQVLAGIVLAGGTLAITLSSLNWRKDYVYEYFKAENHFLLAEHYKSRDNFSSVRRGLSLIPADAPVCASTSLVPHLAMRDVVRCIPNIEGAEYIIIVKDLTAWPLTPKDFIKFQDNMNASPQWELIFEEETTLVWKRKAVPPPVKPAADHTG